MADPQLRCLLCDLILADESAKGQPTERCRQCGRDILIGQTQAASDEPLTLQPLGRAEPPPIPPPLPRPLAVLEDDLPVANVVPKPPPPPADIPTVGPRPRPAPPGLPPLGKKPVQKAPLPPPRRVHLPDPARTSSAPARPQMFTALGILGCMTVLIILCIAVIAFAILYGLKRAASKNRAAAPTPSLVAHPDTRPC